MLKKQSKAICLAVAIVFCLAFIAVAPPAAQASSTYAAVKTPVLKTNTNYTIGNNASGIVFQVDIPEVSVLSSPDVLSIILPSGLEFLYPSWPFLITNDSASASSAPYAILVPANIGSGASATQNALSTSDFVVANNPATFDTASGHTKTLTTGAADIVVTKPASKMGPGRFFVYLNAIKTGSETGTMSATLMAPSNSAFTSGTVVLASNSSGGGTVAGISSVKSFGSSGLKTSETASSPLTIAETAVGTLSTKDTIKIKLPAGFAWDLTDKTLDYDLDGTPDTMKAYLDNKAGGWGYDPAVVTSIDTTDDGRTLQFQISTASTAMAGRIAFPFAIKVTDEAVAKQGDVVAHIFGDDVTEQDVVIAKYGSYSATVTPETKTDIYAGKSGQKLGSFFIEEGLAGSILNGRTIKLTLPEGVKWWTNYNGNSEKLPDKAELLSGNQDLKYTYTTGPSAFFDNGRTIKLGLNGLTSSAGKWRIKDLKVDVAPTFKGDVKVTVSGDAGVSGEVVVANVKPAVEVTVENAKNIVIGQQDQALGDIVIKENVAEAIALHPSDVYKAWTTQQVLFSTGDAAKIALTLPYGSRWSGWPTVTVDGDLQLSTNSMSKDETGRTLYIPVKATSTKPATVKITGLKATLDRLVPEGSFSVDITGSAIDEVTGTNLPFENNDTLSAVVATVVTPAPTESEKVGQFNIGSNIYYVNGAAKIMDVAPYVKAGRTYVPVRYLGYALGLTDDQIKWDAATQTVTFTKGSDSVSVVIGSKTLTKNGAATTMDVAPEIKGGRTMLPARWIAEAFGAQVGWNPANQTVLIQSAVK